MRVVLQRSFWFFMATWLLLSSVGVSWTQSTCLFTGVQKATLSMPKQVNHSDHAQLRRSTCFHFKHFQIKNQSAFSLKKQVLHSDRLAPISANFSFPTIQVALFSGTKNNVLLVPISQSVRRAYLQVYRI